MLDRHERPRAGHHVDKLRRRLAASIASERTASAVLRTTAAVAATSLGGPDEQTVESQAAVDTDLLSGDVPGAVAGKKGHQIGHLLGTAESIAQNCSADTS